MDSLDVRIVRTMGVRPFAPAPQGPHALKPGRIAREVGTTADTVRARLERLEAQGTIAGYQVYPNLRHLGLSAEAHFFSVPDEDAKDAAVGDIEGLDGLMEVHDFLGRGLCIDVAYGGGDERRARLERLSKLTGDPRPLQFYARDMPPVNRALSNLDWRILRALRWDARRSLSEVAEEVGVSYRTVKRRHDRMAREGSFFAVPLLDPSRASGLILFDLLFHLERGAGAGAVNAIRAALDHRHVFNYLPASLEMGHYNMVLFARTSAEVEALRRRGAEVPGVERVEAWLFRSFRDHSQWLDEAIESRISATGP